jgi:hypothetical protein
MRQPWEVFEMRKLPQNRYHFKSSNDTNVLTFFELLNRQRAVSSMWEHHMSQPCQKTISNLNSSCASNRTYRLGCWKESTAQVTAIVCEKSPHHNIWHVVLSFNFNSTYLLKCLEKSTAHLMGGSVRKSAMPQHALFCLPFVLACDCNSTYFLWWGEQSRVQMTRSCVTIKKTMPRQALFCVIMQHHLPVQSLMLREVNSNMYVTGRTV